MSNDSKYTLGPIYIVNFFGTLGFSIVFPFLVFLNLEFGGDSFVFGMLIAVYSIFQIPGAVILGRLSDKIGRKKVLLASHIGTVCSWVVYIFALLVPVIPLHSVESQIATFTLTLPLLLLFVARGFDGLTGGNVAVANAYLADVSSKANITARLGKNSLASDLGLIIGPVIGGTLGSILSGTEAQKALLPVATTLAISAAAVFIILRLRESPLFLKIKKDGASTIKCVKPKLADVLKVPKVLQTMGIFFVLIFTLGLFITVMPLHTQIELDWSALDIAILFAIFGLALVATEGPVISRLSSKISDIQIGLVGFAIMALGYFMFAFSDTMYWYFLAAVPFAAGLGLAATAFHAYATKLAPEHLQGTLQGALTTTDALGAVFGLILGGILYGLVGAYWLYGMMAVAVAFLIPVSVFTLQIKSKNDS